MDFDIEGVVPGWQRRNVGCQSGEPVSVYQIAWILTSRAETSERRRSTSSPSIRHISGRSWPSSGRRSSYPRSSHRPWRYVPGVDSGRPRPVLRIPRSPAIPHPCYACLEHFGVCGGCDFMHLTYEAQLAATEGIIADALRRTGRFADLPDIRMVPNPAPLGDRMRATWNVSHKWWSRILPAGLARGHRYPPLSDHRPSAGGATLDLAQPAKLTDYPTVWTSRCARRDMRPNQIEIEVAGCRFLASADVFFQTTRALLRPFVEHVIASAAPSPTDRVMDLYAGVGLFSIPISALAFSVDGVEGSEAAVLLALENARINNRSNCAFHAMPVETWLRPARLPTL